MVLKGQRDVNFDGESISDGFEAVRRLDMHPKNSQKWPFLGVFGQNLALKWGPIV